MDKQPNLKSITLLNWNANGLLNKRNTLIHFLKNHSITIACITETHLVPGQTFKIPGYNCYREDRICQHAAGGVAIIIKKKLDQSLISIPKLNDLELIAVKITLGNEYLNIISAYKPPKKQININELKQILQSSEPTILMGDLNSKHINWGCKVNTPNGRKLLKASTNLNFQIIAPTNPTHYPKNRNAKPDILDIAIIKNLTHTLYAHSLPELDSDHCPVILTSDMYYIKAELPHSIDTKNIDWIKFQTNVDNALPINRFMKNKEEIDFAVDTLTKIIQNAAKEANTNPNHKPKLMQQTIPVNIEKLIQKKHRIRRQWQQYRSPDLKKVLNKLTCQVKTALDEHRIQQYKNHIKKINPKDNNLWQVTKQILKEPTIIPELKKLDKKATTTKEKCEILAEHFQETFALNPTSNNNNTIQIINNEIITVPHPVKYISPNETYQTIKHLPKKKSAGIDQIPTIILQKLNKKTIGYLTAIFNSMLRIGYYPTKWKHSIIIPIPKPGKNPAYTENYRPISLIPIIAKVIEKLILKRLLKYINEISYIPHFQFGFKEKYSTTHQLLRITELVYKSFEQKKHSLAVFLDVTQAFDRVWHEGLIFKLQESGLPHYLVKIIQSFLKERVFSVRINSTYSLQKEITAGVPQGSPLSATLFNIFTADFPTTQNTTVALFADDSAILTSNKCLNTAIENLQDELNKVTLWADKWKIKLNPNKCLAKIFTLCPITTKPKPLKLFDKTLDWLPKNKAIKYLGVLMDTRLTWTNHINDKIIQANRRLHKLYPLINRKSALKTECTLVLYKAIVLPIIMYACPIWYNTAATNIKKIQTFQNKILRIAVNAPWFIRNSQLHSELKTETIHQTMLKRSHSFFTYLHNIPATDYYNLGQSATTSRIKNRFPYDKYLIQFADPP